MLFFDATVYILMVIASKKLIGISMFEKNYDIVLIIEVINHSNPYFFFKPESGDSKQKFSDRILTSW